MYRQDQFANLSAIFQVTLIISRNALWFFISYNEVVIPPLLLYSHSAYVVSQCIPTATSSLSSISSWLHFSPAFSFPLFLFLPLLWTSITMKLFIMVWISLVKKLYREPILLCESLIMSASQSSQWTHLLMIPGGLYQARYNYDLAQRQLYSSNT